MQCWVGTTLVPDQVKPKKQPQNSLSVYCISTFNTQQHVFQIQTPGEPLTLTVLCSDAVPTPGRGTHTVSCPTTSGSRHAVASPQVSVYYHLIKGLFRLRFPRASDLFVLAAGGSLPSPKLHAGLYKRPRRLGGGRLAHSPAPLGAGEVSVSRSSLFFPTGCKSLNTQLTSPRLARGSRLGWRLCGEKTGLSLSGGFMAF